jgi:hypothetical protein
MHGRASWGLRLPGGVALDKERYFVRSHYRSVLVAMLGVFALVAVSASSAFASASWKIEGKELKAGETAALSEGITSSAHIAFGRENGWKVECTGAKEIGGKLEGPNLYSASGLKLEGCSITASKADKEECSTPSTITTEPVKGTLTAGTATTLTIKASNSEALLTTVKLSGECSAAGTYKITGSMVGEFTGLGEQLSQPLAFTKSSGSNLKYGGEALSWLGGFNFALASGKKWAA